MGSSKRVTVGYRYFMGLHFGICYGPVDAIRRIIVGDREAWSGNVSSNSTISIGSSNLFGGDSREGGVVGPTEIMMGGPTQTAPGSLVSAIGGSLPGFRGILSLYYNGQISANNPYVKPFSFRVSRIQQGWNGGSAWYPEKASIDVFSLGSTVPVTTAVSWSSLTVGNPSYPPPGSVGAFTTANLHPTAITIGPYTTRAQIRIGNASGVGNLSVDDYLVVNGLVVNPGSPQTTPVPAGQMIADLLPGQTAVLRILNTADTTCGGAGSVTAFRESGEFAMNPAHIIYQCLTDPNWGMGYPTLSIGPTFTTVADTLFNEGFGLCIVWNQQDELGNFVQAVLDHIGGVLYVNPSTGKFELKLLRGDYTVGALPAFSPSNLVELESFQRVGYGDTVNEITVVYRDAKTNKDAAITVQDLANIQAQGGVVSQTRQYPGIPVAGLAARVAQRDLIATSTPLAKGRMTVNRSAWSLIPGDVFAMSWPKLGLSSVVCRVLAVDYGDLRNGIIAVDFAEDVFGLPASSYSAQQPAGWVEVSTAPAVIARQTVVEVPYWTLARNLSAADLSFVDADAAYLAPIAAKPQSTSQQYRIWARVGSAPYEEENLGEFAPAATLTAAVNQQAVILALSNPVDLDQVQIGDLAIVGTGRLAEWVEVTSINLVAPSIGVNRGMLDTTPRSHLIGTSVFFSDTANSEDETERATGETVDFNLANIATGGELDYNLATTVSGTAAQRQFRPYPPGNLQVNGVAFPSMVVAPFTLSWAHRNRLQQTAYLVNQTDASIGPEPGTTYNVRVLNDATNATLESESAISGTSWTTTVTGIYAIRVEVESSRGGLVSWQSQIRRFMYDTSMPGTDPYFSSVGLLLHGDGADNSTTITDSSSAARTVTVAGNARIRAAQSRFGGSAIAFDGSGDAISFASSAAFGFGTGDFTLECWMLLSVLPTSGQNQNLFDFRTAPAAQPFVGAFSRTSGGVYQLQLFTNFGAGVAWATATPTVNTWYHVVIQRTSGVLQAFWNGSPLTVTTGSATTASGDFQSSRPLTIGATPGASADFFNGYLDDVRITKGVARYLSTFTVPSSAFPNM